MQGLHRPAGPGPVARGPLRSSSSARRGAVAAPVRSTGVKDAVGARPALEADLQHLNPMWAAVDSQAKFFGILDKLADAGKCPPQLVAGFKDFYSNYRDAVVGSGAPGADEAFATRVQATIADTVFAQFVAPYTFPSFHKRILEPYDYYAFGQRYVGSLIDFDRSAVGNADTFAKINAQLAAGENVVLLANHQTEADPGVFAHMLEATFPRLAQVQAAHSREGGARGRAGREPEDGGGRAHCSMAGGAARRLACGGSAGRPRARPPRVPPLTPHQRPPQNPRRAAAPRRRWCTSRATAS
jgi:hypothetical protein